MVLVEQIYTSCLSQASYYIESNGEAAVIDPSRETNHFIEKAKKSNSEIKLGMPVLSGNNLVGRIVEVNFLSSRILF